MLVHLDLPLGFCHHHKKNMPGVSLLASKRMGDTGSKPEPNLQLGAKSSLVKLRSVEPSIELTDMRIRKNVCSKSLNFSGLVVCYETLLWHYEYKEQREGTERY